MWRCWRVSCQCTPTISCKLNVGPTAQISRCRLQIKWTVTNWNHDRHTDIASWRLSTARGVNDGQEHGTQQAGGNLLNCTLHSAPLAGLTIIVRGRESWSEVKQWRDKRAYRTASSDDWLTRHTLSAPKTTIGLPVVQRLNSLGTFKNAQVCRQSTATDRLL